MSLALSVLNRAISARSCVTLATPHRCLPLEQSRALCTPADPWICAPRLTSRSSSSRPCVARCHAPGQRCLFQRSPPCSSSPVLLAAATLSSLLLGPAKLAPQCATRASLPAPAFWPTSLFLNSSATSSCKGFLFFFFLNTAYFNRDKRGYRSGTPGSRKHGGAPTHFRQQQCMWRAHQASLSPLLLGNRLSLL